MGSRVLLTVKILAQSRSVPEITPINDISFCETPSIVDELISIILTSKIYDWRNTYTVSHRINPYIILINQISD